MDNYPLRVVGHIFGYTGSTALGILVLMWLLPLIGMELNAGGLAAPIGVGVYFIWKEWPKRDFLFRPGTSTGTIKTKPTTEKDDLMKGINDL